MPLRNGRGVSLYPAGLTDALDINGAFSGACQAMANAIFDRQNRGAVVSRPGVGTAITTFSGFTSPGVVSVMLATGTRIYGMLATGRNVGFDEPFVYDTATSAFVTVSNVLSTNVPSSPSTTGAWTPPTMDVIGTKIVVTHPGFSGSNYFGWFDVSNPAAPTWNAGNTSTNALPSKPQWVAQFFNRAYYGVGNAVYFSDSLSATSISAANFAGVLTLGDSASSVAASGLAFSTSSAGILSSLAVFKPNSIYQISGDIALSGSQALSLNIISLNIGCSSPRGIVSTPEGVYFPAIDGPRLIDLRGQLQYVTREGSPIPDIVAPFSAMTTPSRACGAYNNSTYRICFDTVVKSSSLTAADYWYDLLFQRWNGPHSFGYHCAVGLGSTFYVASNTVPAAIFKSDVVPSSTSVYTDNAVAYNSQVQTAILPPVGDMQESLVIETTVEVNRSASTQTYSFQASDDQGNSIASASLTFTSQVAKWGSFVWGDGTKYQSSNIGNHVSTIPWPNPLVFKKMSFTVTSTATGAFSIREVAYRYQPLGIMNE